MKIRSTTISLSLLACAFATSAPGQITGPSTLSTPYILPTQPGYETISLFTVDNTGANPDDTVPLTGSAGTYSMVGIPDGIGAFDNGDSTFTVLMNHELGATVGAVRAHGAIGSFVSRYIINKNTLAVVSGKDLMTSVFNWNTATQASEPLPTSTPAPFGRFCSADLPAPTAFFNAATGLGSQERIFMHGEESAPSNFRQQATVVTGPSAGNSYTLGKFNLLTDGNTSGPGGTLLSGVGAWENAAASPFAQNKTVVIGLNDGGTGIMNNALSVYVGTKTNVGSEVDKAGLNNGVLKHLVVAGNPVEIINATTRATNITNGARFSLELASSTQFSRPEDGSWNPLNPREFYFVTTDRLDQAADGVGTQIGRTRLWRLTFDDITNPDAGGVIDIILENRSVNGELINMFDNLCVNNANGHILLQEDVGGAAHNGKLWDFNPATNAFKQIAKHDPARFGDRIGTGAGLPTSGVTKSVTAPFSNDEETSGIVDITSIMQGSVLHKGNPGEAWYILCDQAHYGSGITAAQVEGGQMLILHEIAPRVTVKRGGFVRDRRTGTFAQQVTFTNDTSSALNGSFFLALDGLSSNATLVNGDGTTSTAAPLGSPYKTVSAANLAPGASVVVTLQFNNPSNASIVYTARPISGVGAP